MGNEEIRRIQQILLDTAYFLAYLRFRFPFPCVMLALPRWLMGLFMCFDSRSISISVINCSFVMAS